MCAAPLESIREERARRIVETAVELAEQGGFEAVRLRDVAAHARRLRAQSRAMCVQ